MYYVHFTSVMCTNKCNKVADVLHWNKKKKKRKPQWNFCCGFSRYFHNVNSISLI